MKMTFAFVLLAALSAQAENTNAPKPKVAVMAFENLVSSRTRTASPHDAFSVSRSKSFEGDLVGYFKVDRGLEIGLYGETARSILEVYLGACGAVKVLDRKGADLIQRESELNSARAGWRVHGRSRCIWPAS
jgi:hypothetical protein